jgi:hypothetical protein
MKSVPFLFNIDEKTNISYIVLMEQNIDSGKKRRSRKLVSLALFLIIFGSIIFVGYQTYNRWYQERQQYVKMGFASDKFPFKMLTERELVEKGLWSGESPALNAVPTRTTPEETYAKFRQALIDGDINKAVECFAKEKQTEYRDALLKAKDEGRFSEIIDKMTEIYPRGEDMTRGGTGDASTTYEVQFKENEGDLKPTSYPISFEKNWDGDWLMEDF